MVSVEIEKEPLPNPFEPKNVLCADQSGLLEAIEREIQEGATKTPNNYPSFLPCVYHNINMEIKQRYSSNVRICYFSFISIGYNMAFCFIISLFSGSIKSPLIHPVQEIILSLFNMIFSILIIFKQYYFPVYTAFKDESPNESLALSQTMLLLFLLIQIIGFCGTGSTGIIYTLETMQHGKTHNKFLSIIASIWLILNLIFQIVTSYVIRPVYAFVGPSDHPHDL